MAVTLTANAGAERMIQSRLEARWPQEARLEENGPILSLIAATPALLLAENDGGAHIAAGLGVAPPIDWPPQHNDAATRDWMREILEDYPHEPGYGTWYIIVEGRLVGVCGFKGPPNADGDVEIGYSILDAEQRRGVAVEAARMLVERAFRDPRVGLVMAHTLPALVGSQKVLARNGFIHVGGYIDAEEGQVMRYEVRRVT